jgi:hypothetical protein
VIRAFRTVMGLARTIFDIAGLRRLATFCAWGTSPFYCFREEKDVVTEVVVSHLQVFDLSRPPPQQDRQGRLVPMQVRVR